jgi:hypothetical protein
MGARGLCWRVVCHLKTMTDEVGTGGTGRSPTTESWWFPLLIVNGGARERGIAMCDSESPNVARHPGRRLSRLAAGRKKNVTREVKKDARAIAWLQIRKPRRMNGQHLHGLAGLSHTVCHSLLLRKKQHEQPVLV